MKAREEILKDALKSVQGVDLEECIQGDKRSLFGVLSSLLKGVVQKGASIDTADSLDDHRAVLQRIKNLPQGRRFMGVKTNDLREVIDNLFCDQGVVLPAHIFKDYSPDDLADYVEICRRIFISKYQSSSMQSRQVSI